MWEQFLIEMKKYLGLVLITIIVLSFGSRVVRAENRDAYSPLGETKTEERARVEREREVRIDQRVNKVGERANSILGNLEKHYNKILEIKTKITSAGIDTSVMDAGLSAARTAIDNAKMNFDQAKTVWAGIDKVKFKTDEVYRKDIKAQFETSVKAAKESVESARVNLKIAIRALKDSTAGRLKEIRNENGTRSTSAENITEITQ